MNRARDALEGHPIYEKVKHISQGAYGVVLLARDRESGEEVALKLIERGEKITRSVEREILNHKKLDHPHVVELKGVTRSDSYLILVLEYAAGGNLRKYFTARGRLSEGESRRLFQQLMLAVDYCHRMGVSSRDIKPDNVLLDANSNVKLADFGYSKDEDVQSLAKTRLGTPEYTAPEIFKLPQAEGKNYDAKAADIWSCGVTLFEMVTGSLPFNRPEDIQKKHSVRSALTMERLLKGEYAFPPDIPLSTELKDLLKGMLNIDPAARLTVKGVCKHPWFQYGLPQGAMLINGMLVSESKATPPSSEEIAAIKAIIEEAQTPITDSHVHYEGNRNAPTSIDMTTPLSTHY